MALNSVYGMRACACGVWCVLCTSIDLYNASARNANDDVDVCSRKRRTKNAIELSRWYKIKYTHINVYRIYMVKYVIMCVCSFCILCGVVGLAQQNATTTTTKAKNYFI